MRKRIASLLLVIVLAISLLSAAVTTENRQMIHPVDSDVYEALKYLYIYQGLSLPSTTGPWSSAELDMMLDRINPDKLNDSARTTYDFVSEELGRAPRLNPDENFGLDVGLKVALDAIFHTNTKDFTVLDDIGGRGDWRAQTPMFSVPLETWIGKNVYGYSSFDLGINRSYRNGQGDSKLLTNIYMVPPCVMDEINCNFPLRAIGSIGSDQWNISIGRDKLSWGPGESGNLVIGDHIPYHNNARFTAFSNHFKYTFSMSSFAHPMNYTTQEKDAEGNVTHEWIRYAGDNPYSNHRDRTAYKQGDIKDGTSMFISHRLEWRIANKVGMALTENIMYQSETNKLDLMILSPTAVFHNYYIRDNANSTLAFEMDYTPIKYLNLYGEMIIDEFKLPGECDPMGPPSAYGFIGGAKTSIPLGKGMLYGSLEGAYTDPYLYLRDNGDSNEHYGINFIVATPEFGNGDASNYTLDFLGYRYGNDSVVANLNVGYKQFGSWFVDAEYTYVADGTFDMHTKWWNDVAPGAKEDFHDKDGNPIFDKDGNPIGRKDPTSPTKEHNVHGSYDKAARPELRDEIAHWNILSLKAGITLFENLDLWGEFNYVNILNYQNRKGNKSSDVQFAIGISYYI